MVQKVIIVVDFGQPKEDELVHFDVVPHLLPQFFGMLGLLFLRQVPKRSFF